MIVTDTFARFGRRMASGVDCPYVVIAETPNPIRQLEPEALLIRATAMLPTIIDGLTTPAAEIERRLAGIVQGQIRPRGVVRSSIPV